VIFHIQFLRRNSKISGWFSVLSRREATFFEKNTEKIGHKNEFKIYFSSQVKAGLA